MSVDYMFQIWKDSSEEDVPRDRTFCNVRKLHNDDIIKHELTFTLITSSMSIIIIHIALSYWSSHFSINLEMLKLLVTLHHDAPHT